MDLTFTPLNSSTAHAYHYDPESQVLTVRYKQADYAYADVPQHKADGLQAADSPHGYLLEHVKPHHTATRV